MAMTAWLLAIRLWKVSGSPAAYCAIGHTANLWGWGWGSPCAF